MTIINYRSFFADTPYSADDPMFALKAQYDADPYKITLGPGAYQDENGKPWILPCVAAAEERMRANPPGHEYLPILGLPAFRSAARSVIFGDALSQVSKRIATLQTISGTGAVHIAAAFLKQFHTPATVYVSNPSWSNHRVMFEYVGFQVEDYDYYDAKTKSVNFAAMRASLDQAKPGDIVILHACAHNPTGCDLTENEWRDIGALMKERSLIPLLDSAYQGFATGDLDRDAFAIRHLLVDLELPGLVCQSFSKSMGLYGERVGALHVAVNAGQESLIAHIESQIGWISRKEISTAGRYGSTIAATIINDPELYSQWKKDLITMSERIRGMRQGIIDKLAELGTPGNWQHVVDQIGMFSYTGIARDNVMRLRDKHIYMAESGRMSVSGLNPDALIYLADPNTHLRVEQVD